MTLYLSLLGKSSIAALQATVKLLTLVKFHRFNLYGMKFFKRFSFQSEMRSRKSSSSSQISSKSKRARKEEMTREFENCLEQVLTWLLEAEEELNLLENVNQNDLKAVRKQFKDFELFMASLTESQDTVGRVLHRGQLLCGKAENEDERTAIEGQLRVVNGRWEALRELSMQRQNELQLNINKLQNLELESIGKWLVAIELEMTSCEPLAATAEAAIQQIEAHTCLQSKIHDFQDTINDLNSFVAVVSFFMVFRAAQLDGLAELCARTNEVFDMLNEWLKEREHVRFAIQVFHLMTFVQIRMLQHAETALEAEHGSFVKLSQLSCELVARLEKGNSAAANDVRRRLDTVTQRWDNLVARIEEHSRTVFLPFINIHPIKIVERFLRHVTKLATELEPLQAWSASFTISKKPEQVRKMINICQEKLIEIKEQEARVNRLQLELEHMHLSSSLSKSQLKKANDAFETFAKSWAKIVTKISEAMNVLTGQDMSDKETRVAKGILLVGFKLHLFQNKNVTFIEKDPLKRAILKKGLDIVRKRIEVLTEVFLLSVIQFTLLKKEDVKNETQDEQTTSKTEAEVNLELENKWCTVGDVDLLDKEVQRAQKIVELARKEELNAETIEKKEKSPSKFSNALYSGWVCSIAVSVEATSSSDLSIGGTIVELEHAREQLTSYQTLKKEAERAAEKMLALDDNVPQTVIEVFFQLFKTFLLLLNYEHYYHCDDFQNLESLLEKVDSPLEVDESSIPSMDELFVRESYLRLNETRRRLADATRKRIAALSRAVADCEHFEKQMADIQQWSSTVSTLLDLRKSSDVSALDVPDEYKAEVPFHLFQELAREFEIWSTTLEEIGDWLQQGERRDNERFHDQFTHAKNTMMELSLKFANFKHPRAFEEKLERTFHKLGDIEISLDDMTGIEAVFCSETLDDAKRLVKKLISIEEDVHSLEKGKEQLIQVKKDSLTEDTIERLEDCVETYAKLLQESEAVEIFLDGLDSNDEEAVQELVNEWNRHEASLRNLEELERVLREYAVKVSDSVCAEKRRRADALKMRLDGWTRTVQEMNNDEETLLMEVDELHGYLVNELDKIKDKEPEEIASSLRFLRGDRDRLSSRARKLAAMNPRLANAKLCSEVADRWQQLESRLHSPPPVDLLKTKFVEAEVSLDFDASPVSDVYQWEKRVKAVDDFLNESQAVLNEVIETGRNLANSGRMELDTHCAIEKLDEIVAIADQVPIESQKSALEPLFAQAEALDRDREAAEEVVDSLTARNLDDPVIANATRQDLADRDSQFAALSQRAARIHAALPGKSSSSRDTTLATLGDKLSRLESILIAKHVVPSRAANATPIRTSPDRTSMSSTGPLGSLQYDYFNKDFMKNLTDYSLKQNDDKHQLRQGLENLQFCCMIQIRSDLVDRLQSLAQLRRDCESFWRIVDDVAHRGRDLQRRAAAINEAVIFTPSPDHVMACRSDAAVLKNDVALIKERVQQVNANHEKLGGKYEKVDAMPRLNARDSANWQMLTQLRHWLNELERDASLTVDLCDRNAIRDMTNTVKVRQGNAILDTYIRDDAHTMSHELSKLNMRWSKFNDNLRIRRAVLEATLRSHNDFNTAFIDFEEWLKKIATRVTELETLTQNTQALKDTAKRHEWIQQHKDLESELNAHESVLTAVDAMGQKLCAGQESGKEKSDVQNRLNAVCQKWKDIDAFILQTRLTEAEQEWEKLTNILSSLIGWIEDKSKEMLSQQPVGGCLSAVMAQSEPQINEAITNAHSFLMQHDLRPKIHRTGVLAEDDDADKLDVVQRRCGLKIHADCEKLKEKWAELGTQFTDWDQAVHAAALRLQELERALAECQLHLSLPYSPLHFCSFFFFSAVESEVEHLRPVERLRLEELKDARRVCESLAIRVGDLRIHVDDANDACGRVLAADAPLDQHPRNQLDAVNERFLALKTALRIRSAALRNALADFGPSSEHFLNQSVALPWQRAISKTNQLPYYIDHTTEKTQWEHPVWVEMTKELSQFNRVKFIAYRTAMKLRALQKRLCLDLIDIPMLEKCFSRLVGLSNEESPGLEGMVSSILPLFEQLNAKYPQMVRSVALAVDLCINFLLNLFDPSRDGLLRVLSFKIALTVLSSAPLEEKYRFLFNLVAQDGQADQKHIALLLYDLIQIPRLVGEAAAFGGSNVEPSVRSCFEMVRLAPTISLTPFLEWMKQEPQSVVWLPVMHRLATAEFAKHQAKCNVCKMFPIVGLRYRCLRCFNLDLCQNCFFSQRTAKKHKLKHPMQEYAVPTTSTEDARDFARMVRNKFSRSKNSLGYLPVDVTDEGRPLAALPPAAQNAATEALHQRSATLANRLALLTASLPAEPRDERVADIQSPAQIINQVEQMQKDELDQVLQRLQLENLELKRELERRKLAVSSTPDLDKTLLSSRRSVGRGATLPRPNHGRSVPSLQNAHSQNDVMDEARALRLHKQRLEHRSRILEQQNEQLELQLRRLKKVIEQVSSGDRTREQLASQRALYDSSSRSRLSERTNWKNDGAVESENRTTRMQSLLATVDDLGRAMENLVVSVVYDSDQEH
ncbi:unnamed protein product [Angiostrongylus costaricensis]|uniref:Spectrin repeat-containing domain protein n=1 Tax=Angiostrongylus costaricensis TaxID=334426 RepID=A0A158PHC4_ANGCS|nr:unnamed protein product [Angiostrongylus costaricensis]